jgi:hypothetical protein
MLNPNLVWECYRLLGIFRPDEWRVSLEKCLEKPNSPYRYDIRKTSLRIWNPSQPEILVPGSDHTCRNGYELQRVASDRPGKDTLVGITLTRLVFEAGSRYPTPFSTDELFSKGKYPEVLRHQPMIAGIKQLIEYINQSLEGSEFQPYTDYTVVNHAKNIFYRFGDRSYSLSEIVEKPGLSKNLLNAVRGNKALIFSSVNLGILSNSVRESDKAIRIGEEVVKVLREWGCNASLTDLKNGDVIDDFLTDSSRGRPITLVPLEGKKGDRPPDLAMKWLKYLDSEKAAFHLCSTSSNPMYSRHGLAIVILAKANGSIFIAEPVGFPNFHQSWFIGLDLGKGGMSKGKVFVITLTSSDGILQAYWRAKKGDDETLSPELLREGLEWIVSKADDLGAGKNLYLLRDGLRPHNESLESYYKALLGRDFTLIEYVKSGSPLIHCSSFEPEPGTTILPNDSGFTTLYPHVSPQHGVLTTPVKFRVPINPNRHSASEISLLLTTLCHSATLSYQPSRLPAPLQWANGIARISYTDLQFSGWSHRPSKLVERSIP